MACPLWDLMHTNCAGRKYAICTVKAVRVNPIHSSVFCSTISRCATRELPNTTFCLQLLLFLVRFGKVILFLDTVQLLLVMLAAFLKLPCRTFVLITMLPPSFLYYTQYNSSNKVPITIHGSRVHHRISTIF